MGVKALMNVCASSARREGGNRELGENEQFIIHNRGFWASMRMNRTTAFLDGYCSTVNGLLDWFEVDFSDGYCSNVQGLLDWFEVDLGFTELLFIQIGLCVMCVFVLYSPVSLSSCPFLDVLHCLPRAVGVPLESALNLVSRMSPCGAYDTHT